MTNHSMIKGSVEVQQMLWRPTRIRLLTEAELPYRHAIEPVAVHLLLLPGLVITHANELVWAPISGLLEAERARPPEAWCVEQLKGPSTDPDAWFRIAQDGLEMDDRSKAGGRGTVRNGQVIRIAAETLIFGGSSTSSSTMRNQRR